MYLLKLFTVVMYIIQDQEKKTLLLSFKQV